MPESYSINGYRIMDCDIMSCKLIKSTDYFSHEGEAANILCLKIRMYNDYTIMNFFDQNIRGDINECGNRCCDQIKDIKHNFTYYSISNDLLFMYNCGLGHELDKCRVKAREFSELNHLNFSMYMSSFTMQNFEYCEEDLVELYNAIGERKELPKRVDFSNAIEKRIKTIEEINEDVKERLNNE